jgi:hypothetical protein
VSPSDSPTPSQSPSEQPSDAPSYVVDWGSDAVPVDLGDGWSVRDCEGDAPLLCVDRDGDLVGTLALSSFEPTDDLAAADTPDEFVGALQAFAESLEDGAVTEFVLSYATVADARLWIVVADAVTADGCMASEFDLFTPDHLETFLPLLDGVVAGTVLPDSTA